MAELTKEHPTISSRDIDELKAIYEDYLYMVRKHELVFRHENIDELSFRQIQSMYPACEDPRQFSIPWYVEKLNTDEQQEFADYIKNNIKGDGHKTYVSIQHFKPEDNNDRGPMFAIEPYTNLSRTMQFPSMIEEYTLSYPKGATLGNTEFFIDGRYKAVYFGDKAKDKPLADFINDLDLIEEITIMLNLGECFRKNSYMEDKKFERMAVNIYAAEMINLNENNLLEILGSFAEKVKNICHARYHDQDKDIQRAKEDGFLNIPDNFQDYLNIRDLMRHQWDTLDDLDGFTQRQAKMNKKKRTERVNSYLKLCDKTLYQRMISFVEALYQMQQIISEIDHNRIIRGVKESNNKFINRVKDACRKNPDTQIEVEINYSFETKEYKTLDKFFHKNKIFPHIKIIDDTVKDPDKLELMFDYQTRSLFLCNFHDIACYAMAYCQRHGKDTDTRGAWNYLEKIGLITSEECQKWQNYTNLRNIIAHNYFDTNVRNKLKKIHNDEQYRLDFQLLANKMYKTGPDVKKIQDDIYEYKHSNGEVVRLDFNNHTITHNTDASKLQKETQNMIDNIHQPKQRGEIQKETYPNGIEFELQDEKITQVKLPIGMTVNIERQNIKWDICTHWYMNAEYFNVLKTDKSKIVTDKDMFVTEFYEKNRRRPYNEGDCLLIDFHHNLTLDGVGRLREFKFKNSKGEVLRTEFKHAKDGRNLVILADATKIVQTGKEITVIHDDKILNYEGRHEFAATYGGTQISPQQIVKQGNSR